MSAREIDERGREIVTEKCIRAVYYCSGGVSARRSIRRVARVSRARRDTLRGVETVRDAQFGWNSVTGLAMLIGRPPTGIDRAPLQNCMSYFVFC